MNQREAIRIIYVYMEASINFLPMQAKERAELRAALNVLRPKVIAGLRKEARASRSCCHKTSKP